MIHHLGNSVRNRRTAGRVSGAALAAATAIVILTGCQATTQQPQPQPVPTPTNAPAPAPAPTPAPAPPPAADTSGLQDVDTSGVQVIEPRLFIGNRVNNADSSVISYANPSTVNGNIAPDTSLQGSQTRLHGSLDVVVNAAGQLLVTNSRAASINVYDDAATANGNLAPDGIVQGAATQLLSPVSLALNTAQDLMFVANLGGNDDIQVFAGTEQATFNGNLPPVRTISNDRIKNTFAGGINFGSGDDLYFANRTANEVLVFANASSLAGTVEPTRVITSPVFTDIDDVFIDDNDNMFVVDFTGFIFTFRNASTLNGDVTPDLTLEVPLAPGGALISIAVDSSDTGYIVDIGSDAIYSYDNISNLNGALVPDRTIQGPDTQLNSPSRIFLVE